VFALEPYQFTGCLHHRRNSRRISAASEGDGSRRNSRHHFVDGNMGKDDDLIGTLMRKLSGVGSKRKSSGGILDYGDDDVEDEEDTQKRSVIAAIQIATNLRSNIRTICKQSSTCLYIFMGPWLFFVLVLVLGRQHQHRLRSALSIPSNKH
jgi:hypothetical protein